MKQLSPTGSKVTLIALGVSLIGAVLFSMLYLIPKYRFLDQSPPPELFGQVLHQANHGNLILPLVSEYRVRNDGAYPPSEYLEEILGPSRFGRFYEKIEVKVFVDDPSSTAWPSTKELHVWPGYACAHERPSLFRNTKIAFTADEVDYQALIRKDPQSFVMVFASMGELSRRWPDPEPVYTCS